MDTTVGDGAQGAPEKACDPRVEIVHDYLTQRGGAERVVLAMSDAFPSATVHTSLYEPSGTYAEFADRNVKVSWLNRFASVREDHRKALPLLAPTFSRMTISNAEAVLCSSSGWAHAIRSDAPKIVYCYAPARWLYQPDRYAGRSVLQRHVLRAVGPILRRWGLLQVRLTVVGTDHAAA